MQKLYGRFVDLGSNIDEFSASVGSYSGRQTSVERNVMIEVENTFSGFAVEDIAVAKEFYENTIGLKVTELEMGLLQIETDNGNILVYPKADHSPASFTVLNFAVADIDRAVDALTSSGVEFERYDTFEHDDKGIVRSGAGPQIAWFTDPSGNICAVMEG